MPETAASSSTREITGYLTEKLREFACTLRTAYQNGASMEELRAKKDDMMQTIYNMLCISLGKPPVKFDFEVKTPKRLRARPRHHSAVVLQKSTSTWIFPGTSASSMRRRPISPTAKTYTVRVPR